MYFSFFFVILSFIFLFFLSLVGGFGSFTLGFYLFSFMGLDVSFSFLFDFVSLGFFSAVSFISGMVFFYSLYYMEGTVDLRRFFLLVFGFVLSMLFLVFSGNFLVAMVGWDGLGLISFCLVIFYSNYSSLESGLITVLSNRVGDVFFLGSFFFFFSGGFGVSDLFADLGVLFFGFLFFGAITKSAQIPFSAWLPAAMAAPTPVSSLVHSSTLVTAGIYVLLRFWYLFDFFNFFFMKIFFLFTMLVSGVSACFETDFKKIVAMSTLSQLGLMLFVLSIGMWVLTFFHMIIHAFFKSMLFLNTGCLMTGLSGGQDSRFYGGDSFSYSVFLCFTASSFCLMGFPFFIGFYSKDLILLGSFFMLGSMYYFVFICGCLMTVYYSFRLIFISFWGLKSSYPYFSLLSDWLFSFSVLFLFFFSWALGGFLYWSVGVGIYVFSGFDMVVGILMIFSVYFLYFFFVLSYKLTSFFLYIGHTRWLASFGGSMTMSKYFFFRWDSSWLEVFGGQGVFHFLSAFSFFDWYKFLGLGILFISSMMFLMF